MLFRRVPAKLLRFLSKKSFGTPQKCLSNFNMKNFSSKPSLEINNINLSEYITKIQIEYGELSKSSDLASNPRYKELKPIISLLTERDNVIENITSVKELKEDEELSQLAKEEEVELEDKLQRVENELFEALLPIDESDSFDSIVLEVQAGVGGQEAMLFAQELFNMYCNYITQKGWQYQVAEYFASELGGLRHGSILIDGQETYRYFKHEAGVHRVQRIPTTEKAGRIHTSTVSVVALPQPSEIDIQIDSKDLKIETKRATGAGGQHVNTTDSAVRIVHLPTNTAVDCQMERSQIKNRQLALTRLRAILYQKELDSRTEQLAVTRKTQVKSNNRNEKIRTYNFNQDRITDHRLQGVHFHNIQQFVKQGFELDKLIEQLERRAKIERLLEIVRRVCK